MGVAWRLAAGSASCRRGGNWRALVGEAEAGSAAELKRRDIFVQRPSRSGCARLRRRDRFGRFGCGENQRAVEVELFELRVKREQIFEFVCGLQRCEADSKESGKFCDADGFDDIGVFRG